MNIESNEVKQYAEQQIKIFKELGGVLYSEFNDGVVVGLELVKTFINLYQNKEGVAIAEALELREVPDGHKN